jgi:hypothetical protein
MSLTFNVCRLRGTSYNATSNNSGGRKTCTITFTEKYLVTASGITSPDQVTDIQVAYAAGIPIVNYNTWYDPTTGLGFPLAVCKSKKVTRLDQNGFAFHVDVSYATEPPQGKESNGPEQEMPGQNPPADVTEIPAQVSRSIVGREIVLYEAPAVNTEGTSIGTGGAPVTTRIMPSAGNKLQELFDAPVTRTKPLLRLSITQFENSFSNATMMGRCFKVNDATWAGLQPGSCMITNISAVKQSIQMSTGQQEKYRVTYTVDYDDYTVADNSGNTLFVGHSCALPLISRTYLENDEIRFFVKEGTGIGNVGLIDALGTAKVKEDQHKAPDYVRFDTVDEISFSFLPTTI